MANINDVSNVIASALAEVSVVGTLDVSMDGRHMLGSLGTPGDDDVEITVTVTPVSHALTPERAAHAC